LEGNLNNKLR